MVKKIHVLGFEYDEQIVMTKEGRYITLKKEFDDNKYFRYDLATNQFERVNIYKKGIKTTPVKTSNITGWFKDCSLYCTDIKFAKLVKWAERDTNNIRFKSLVRFIEQIGNPEIQKIEQWLSLGILIKEVEECFNNKRRYHYSNEILSPNDIDKETLQYIKELNRPIEIDEIRKFNNSLKNNRGAIIKQLQDIESHPTFNDIFKFNRWGYDYDILDISKDDSYGARRREELLRCIEEYNLDLNALCTFINRMKQVEALNIDELLEHYRDYLSMELFLHNQNYSKMDKYPNNFLTLFKIVKREYNANKQQYDEMRFKYENNKIRNLEYSKDGLSIIVPNDPQDVKNEGAELHHCVATYIGRIIEGETHILFLRETENINTPLVTIELKGGHITQAYASHDKKPEDKHLEFIKKWANINNIIISWIWNI